MLGQVGCNIAFTLIYIYAAELFPTGLRNVGVGTSSTLARIGGLLQPQMALTVSTLQILKPLSGSGPLRGGDSDFPWRF